MKFFFCTLVLLSLSSISYTQKELVRILFVLDASNSMNADWGNGQTRIEAAKEILVKHVDSLVNIPNLEIALRVYGHQSPITATYQDCNDTKLEIPFDKNNYLAVKNKIKTIKAKGTTPIARSLEAAADDFPDQNARNIIILITDGIEACDNDPCLIAKKIKDKNINITPFVIGLGLDLSYLEKFKCIGSFQEAETKDAFKNVLKSVINKALVNTTAQININDLNKNPKETDVSMILYQAGTKNIIYTFVHTMNRYGHPDTLVINPDLTYDLEVHTIPKIEKKNIRLLKNTHNVIEIDGPQGFIRTRFSNATKDYPIEVRIMQEGKENTLHVQKMNSTEKYLIGKYKAEVLSLPRIYTEVEVSQSSTSNIDIPAPGLLMFKSGKYVVAQVFTKKSEADKWEWVYNLESNVKSGYLSLLPGLYKIIYRPKPFTSTSYTFEKEFRIQSNKTVTVHL
ncbi:MAG: VWA domain-containing protein [Flavobacteriia bacterium]|nr:VWA domain-containing protein [Flavobacteriia bacterium]